MTTSPNPEAIETATQLLRQLETTNTNPEPLELKLRIFLEKHGLRLRHLRQTEASLGVIMSEAYKRHALQLLEQVRSQEAPPHKLTTQIEQVLRAAGFTPGDINSTADEIQKPRRRHYRQIAQRELKRLKRVPNHWRFDRIMEALKKTLEEAHCTLEDLGSTKEHLAALKQAATKRVAIESLSDLKNGRDVNLLNWRQYWLATLEEAGLTLGDIGCTDSELEHIIAQAHKANAQALLNRLYTLEERPDDIHEQLMNELRYAGCNLEDLKSSDAQVESLMRDALKRFHRRSAVEMLDALKQKDASKQVVFHNIESQPESYKEQLAHCLKKAGCTLEELGGSIEELKVLIDNACAQYARRQADDLWSGRGEASLPNLRRALELTDCTLEDFGYSEKDLAKKLQNRRKQNRS